MITIAQLIDTIGKNSYLIISFLFALPVLSLFIGALHGKGYGGKTPWKYIYALLIYLAVVPGIFSVVLTVYALFFINQNLLHVNIMVYFMPILSMALSLFIIRRNVAFGLIPGFDRLSGLVSVLVVTFIIVFALSRTRIWMIFGGSMYTLVGFAMVLFIVLKLGTQKLFGDTKDV